MPRALETSPTPSASSDKENRNASSRRVSAQKRSAMNLEPSGSAAKKRRTGLVDRNDSPMPSGQAASGRHVDKGDEGKAFYDPDQPVTQRRLVRKKIRDMDRDVTDSRNELVAPGSHGILDKFKESDVNFKEVKQTTDATIDSRMLVKLGDMAAKRASNTQLGGAANGIDVDQFVAKSFAFMRKGPTESDAQRIYPSGSSQRQRHRPGQRRHADSDDEDDVDDGDAVDWEWMGRKAAFPSNKRPPVPIFLLGPLSVQKKIRKVTQRVARQRLNPEDAIRPDELKLNEIERDENANLVKLCKNISILLDETNATGCDAAEAELGEMDDPTDAQIASVMEKHGVADDGGSLLCRFAFNPKSFGQTVENLFYISFLIREGKIGLGIDSRGFQTLQKAQPSEEERVAGEDKFQQGVFHLDFDVWEDTCKLFDIKESTIPHRQETSTRQAVGGWYN